MQKTNKTIVADFIQQIWNEGRLENLPNFIHPDYIDHSLPVTFPTGVEGLSQWIMLTGKSFEHRTVIEEQVTEADKSILKIKMVMKHIGEWRGIAATGREVSTVGYRLYRLAENRIIEHWGLIDGTTLENQLNCVAHGCKVAR